MKRFIAVLMMTALVALTLTAQSIGWKLDKAHSSVTFTVKHLVISEVRGNFKDFEIIMDSTKENISDAVVGATIRVASINTDNERRDGHLKSDDFFNAEKFPEITFKRASFEKVGDNFYRINGDLTIRDITKKVFFDAVYNGSLKTGQGTVAAWKATLVVNRFDYGLKWDGTIETGGVGHHPADSPPSPSPSPAAG